MTLCALHNGGGVWASARRLTAGSDCLLDGSARVDEIIESAISWDVMGGVARRGWAGNAPAVETAARYNAREAGKAHITLPHLASEKLLDDLLSL